MSSSNNESLKKHCFSLGKTMFSSYRRVGRHPGNLEHHHEKPLVFLRKNICFWKKPLIFIGNTRFSWFLVKKAVSDYSQKPMVFHWFYKKNENPPNEKNEKPRKTQENFSNYKSLLPSPNPSPSFFGGWVY